MIYKLELTEEEAALLVKILTNKAKEINRWRIAQKDGRRDGEYYGVCNLLKKIHTK